MNSPSSATSSWFRPPAGSSRRSRRGLRDERARELDALLRSVRQRGRRRARRSTEPDDVERPRAPRSRRPCGRGRARRRARSRARTSSGRAGCSGTSARRPLRTILNAGCLQKRRAVEQHVARVGLVETRDDVERRSSCRAPFGPIRPEICPCSTSKETPSRRDDAAEAQRDVPYLEEGHRSDNLKWFCADRQSASADCRSRENRKTLAARVDLAPAVPATGERESALADDQLVAVCRVAR